MYTVTIEQGRKKAVSYNFKDWSTVENFISMNYNAKAFYWVTNNESHMTMEYSDILCMMYN